jgi:[ribosomal protein S18]-alanine N-acetyltransferase
MNETEISQDRLRIRPIEPPHISGLIRLGESTNLSPWTAQCYLDELKNPDAIMMRLVGEDNSTIGFVVGRFVPSNQGDIDAEIYNIAVKPRHQRQGCGQRLFEAFIERCRDRNASNIWLEVRESNEKAIAFYSHNGFQRVQTRNHFYTDPREHGWLMRLDLKKVRLDNFITYGLK